MTLATYADGAKRSRPAMELLHRIVNRDGGDPGPAVRDHEDGRQCDEVETILRRLSNTHPDEQLALEADTLWQELRRVRARYRDPHGATN